MQWLMLLCSTCYVLALACFMDMEFILRYRSTTQSGLRLIVSFTLGSQNSKDRDKGPEIGRKKLHLSRRATWAIEAPFKAMQRFCYMLCVFSYEMSAADDPQDHAHGCRQDQQRSHNIGLYGRGKGASVTIGFGKDVWG